MTRISVKPEYARIYDGLYFEGQRRDGPKLHHGAWICTVFVTKRAKDVTFRLGHLEQLTDGVVDLLRKAQEAGWSTAVAASTREVAFWTARECAMDALRSAGLDHESVGELPDGPRDQDRRTLEDNLGGPADALELALFEREFTRTLRDPTL